MKSNLFKNGYYNEALQIVMTDNGHHIGCMVTGTLIIRDDHKAIGVDIEEIKKVTQCSSVIELPEKQIGDHIAKVLQWASENE